MIDLRLFGAPHLERDGSTLTFRRRKGLALLAYLALNDGPQSRESLATLLWSEFDESRARGNLRRELSLIRSAIGIEVIKADRMDVMLDTANDFSVDVLRFQRLAHSAHDSASPEADLTLAARIYSGDFLAGFHVRDSPEFENWRAMQATQLQFEFSTVLKELIGLLCQRYDFEAAIPYANRIVELDPFHEANQRTLSQILGWAGHWSAANSHIEQVVAILRDELGVDPEPETLELERLITTRQLPLPTELGQSVAGAVPRFQHTWQSAQTSKSNLPVQRSAFIGREREIREVDLLLSNPIIRIVSIVGPGGIGKTRLALAVAERQLADSDQKIGQPPRFKDGAFFIDLSQASSAEQITRATLNILGLEPDRDGDEPQAQEYQLISYLRNKELLLVLDNAEHLRQAVSTMLSTMDQAPGIKVLVTTREPLQRYGEHTYFLQGLAYPNTASSEMAFETSAADAYPAILLFEQSARRAQHDFELNADNIQDVARITRLVEGMPLGLELAGSWVHLLSPEEILAELERGIDLLETSDLDVPARQQSIRAIFDSTWENLSKTDQEMLARLSVFRGGFNRIAAQKITGVSLSELRQLTSRSLIQFDRSTHRYYMHELLRQYLDERLKLDAALQEDANAQHSIYFCHWIQEQANKLLQEDQHSAAEQIRTEFENVRVAWIWAIDARDVDLISQATDGFGHFFTFEGRYREGHSEFSVAAEEYSSITPQTADVGYLAAHLLTWRSIFERFLGEVSQSDATVEMVLSLLDHPQMISVDTRWLRAFLKLQMAAGFFVSGDLSGESYRESRDLFTDLDDRWGVAMATAAIGYAAFVAEDYDRASRNYLAAVDELRTIGDRRSVVYLLGRLSALARYQGNWRDAEKYARESLELVQKTGTQGEIAEALGNLGGTLFFLGKFKSAIEILAQAAHIIERLGTTGHSAAIQLRLGHCFGALGHLAEAREHLVNSRDQYAHVDQSYTAVFIDTQIAVIDIADGDIERAQQILDTGIRELSGPEYQVDLSWFLYLSGVLDWRKEKLNSAIEVAANSLHLCLEIGGFIQLHWSLLLSALVLDEMEGCEVEAAVAWNHVLNQPWISDNVAFQLLTNQRINERRLSRNTPARIPDPYATAKEQLDLIQSYVE